MKTIRLTKIAFLGIPAISCLLITSPFTTSLAAEIGAVGIGTTGIAEQTTAAGPSYLGFMLDFVLDTENDVQSLEPNPAGGAYYNGNLVSNFPASNGPNDSLRASSALFATTGDLYTEFPLGGSFEINFLHNSVERIETGERLSAPAFDLPAFPQYVTGVQIVGGSAPDAFWADGVLNLDVRGIYHLTFHEYAQVPMWSEAIIRGNTHGGQYWEALVEGPDMNLPVLEIDGSQLVNGNFYAGQIEALYGDITIGSHDPTFDFMRSMTYFDIAAIPEPRLYPWIAALSAIAFVILRRKKRA
jgi:hypothetical protein